MRCTDKTTYKAYLSYYGVKHIFEFMDKFELYCQQIMVDSEVFAKRYSDNKYYMEMENLRDGVMKEGYITSPVAVIPSMKNALVSLYCFYYDTITANGERIYVVKCGREIAYISRIKKHKTAFQIIT